MARDIGPENYRRQLHAILNKQDHIPILSEIHCPTLIIASQNDCVMPSRESDILADKIRNAELVTIENCGHLVMLEQPDRLNRIISDWI